MKRLALLGLLFATPAFAQAPLTGLTAPSGQGAPPFGIPATAFNANTDSVGFGEYSLTPALIGAGTTQATATLIVTRTSLITSCPAGTGVQLPAVTRYQPVTVINRSGGTCLVYPTLGATVESVPGTAGAVNAGFAMASNTYLIFRPISPTSWMQ